jgi:lipoprotein NlpI
MSSLAELPELVGFFSYSREDDEAFKGALSALRDGIQRELSAQLGRSKTTFRLWQDQAAIAPGKLWESEIKTAIDQSVFFIPIVTPRVVNSKYCKFEFESFLAREATIGRSDLVFPIVYISVAALEDEAKWRDDPVLSIIARRQYVDWRPLRHLDAQTTAVREHIERLCRKIVEALNEPWVSPEERRRIEEAKARQQAEDGARRLEAEAKRRADEEEGRRQAEAAARQRAEDERSRQEAEAKRHADEEEGRRQAEAAARQRADEERSRQEAEAKLRAEQEQAFVAAKRADVVGVIDAFLANHPDSRHTTEAWTLRAALVARDEACKASMASDDPAVLKAFLKTYPKGSLAEQVRGRLRSLEPQTAWRSSRALLLIGCLLGVGLVGSIGVWVMRAPPSPPEGTSQLPGAVSVQPVPLPTVADDLATCKNASGDDVIAACSRVIASGSASPDDLRSAHFIRGAEYAEKHDYDRAIADYNETLRLDPEYAGVFIFRGDAYRAKQNYDRAMADYNEGIRLDPKYAYGFVRRGNAYHFKQNYDRAIADYNEAIRLDPTSAYAFVSRGGTYYAMQNFDRAIADYNEAIRLDPKDAEAFTSRGYVAYYVKQNYDRAIADYNEAIRLDPKLARAYYHRGRAYLYSGTPAKALADVRQASELDQKYPYYALWVDIIGQRNNLPSRLSQLISKIDMTAWPAPVIRMFLGQMTPAAVLAAADDPDAYKKKGQVCEANFFSGELALMQGTKAEALRRFRLAVSDCPKHFDEWVAANAELKALGAAR